jgi:hypothetical protein
MVTALLVLGALIFIYLSIRIGVGLLWRWARRP